MASLENDKLMTQTAEGSFNFYDRQRSCATAIDKGLAARLSGHSYNIINNSDKDEIYFRDLRHDDHFVDKSGKQTTHWFGSRRRLFPHDQRNLIGETMRHPDAHPREHALAQRRAELQLAQMENPRSYRGFQDRAQSSLVPTDKPKRYSINNKRYANEVEGMREKMTDKAAWRDRRGEHMEFSASAPSVSITDPSKSLAQAMHEDTRKEATHLQAECLRFSPTNGGSGNYRHLSVSRLENYDFAVTKKNNHFSQKDKLTRADPYFVHPGRGVTSNSVKYDIVNNERKWYCY